MRRLREEVEDALGRFPEGRVMLKSLFWEALDFDRIELPVPEQILPRSERQGVHEALIWAESADTTVVLCQLTTSHLRASAAHDSLRHLVKAWPESVVVYTNLSESHWDFHVSDVPAPGCPALTRRFPIDQMTDDFRRLASALLRFSPETRYRRSSAVRGIYRLIPPRVRQELRSTPFESFLQQAATHPVLTREEEVSLAKRIQDGDEEAWEQLVCCNVRLAIWAAGKFAGRGVDIEDLVQDGLMAVMRAARLFDPELGFKFSTYATRSIVKQCMRSVQRHGTTVRIPSRVQIFLQKLYKLQAQTRAQEGYGLSSRQVEERFPDVDMRRILRALSVKTLRRLDVGEPLRDDTDSDSDPCMIVQQRADTDVVFSYLESALNGCKPRDCSIVRMRFGLDGREPRTLQDIGSRFGLTKERVRQIVLDMLSDLSDALRSESPLLFDGQVLTHACEESGSSVVADSISSEASLPPQRLHESDEQRVS